MANVKNNLRATAWPQATDDTAAGYSKGSQWFCNGILLVCADATANAAKWLPITVGGAQVQTPVGYNKPINFANFAAAALAPNSDTLYLFPFLINRPMDAAAIHMTVAGSAGAAAVFGLYPHDPVTGKPDGQARIGGSLGGLTLDGTTGDRVVGFTGGARDLSGLFWLGLHLKAVTTMPTIIPMNANGMHIHRGDLSDHSGGAPLRCYAVNATYTGSAPATVPATGTSTANAPVPSLRTAA